MSATRLLDASLVEQLRGYLTLLRHDIELTAVLDDSEVSAQTWELLETVASLSDRVTARRADPAPTDRVPSFTVGRRGDAPGRVCFAGLPLGHEFTSLVLALLNIGGHPSKAAPELLSRIAAIETPMRFETFYSQSCQNCPDVVQALNLVAALNPNVTHTAIDGASFASEAERRSVLAVPAVFLDGEEFASGRLGLTEILDLLAGPASRPEDTTTHEPFDVLVVGGGPAGCAAAVYAARKGVRTGMLAERLGGQVKDTLGIENLVSVLRTEGPELASALEAHVRAYDVEILTGRRAVSVRRTGDSMFEVTTNTGATLNARTVVLSPGAAWRTLGVTGEQEYKNRGVTFCPHCDGPLFAGKDVAVVGGGNSGVEAAIDLAGIARHVTLLEFAPSLRADAVLQRALAALDNVTVRTSARTTEILGDGRRVTGLRFQDVQTGLPHDLELSGVFVQIGLTPNTDWLAGTLELTPQGEIEITPSGRTSVDGVFAAGDATTTPYKQIVVALGSGATAALSAFDHLIRHRAPHEAQVPELTSV